MARGRLTARQEAARRATTRHIKRSHFDSRIPQDKPITENQSKYDGGGKGNVEYYVAEIQPVQSTVRNGRRYRESLAREAFALAAAKLPIATTFVTRQAGK